MIKFATNVCSLRGQAASHFGSRHYHWSTPKKDDSAIPAVFGDRWSLWAQMNTQNLLHDLIGGVRLQEDSNEPSGGGTHKRLVGNTSFLDVPPIQRLPTELLISIFLECLRCTDSINKHKTTPITLKKVCRLWESIICDLPNAWKNLKLHQYSFADLEDVLDNHFRYRGQHRLKVDISIYNNIEHNYPTKQMKSLETIRDNFKYFEAIAGHINPTVLHELFGREYDYDMATLRTLDLEISPWNFNVKAPFLCSTSFRLDNVETLKLFNLGYLLYSSNLKSSLDCLRLLSLDGDHSDYLLDHSMVLTILSVACNLQEFSWTPSRDSGESLLEVPTKLPKLTKLQINLQSFSADIIPIMTALEIPHLTEFHIEGYDHPMTDDYMCQTLICFVSARGSCIQSLTMNNLPINSEIWERHAQHMPNLKSLQVEGELGNRFLQCLTDTSTYIKLSKLECLTISRRVFSSEEVELLLKFAKSRKDVKRNCAQLKTMLINCAWDSSSYDEFQNRASEHINLDWQVNLFHSAPQTRTALDIQFDHLSAENF